RHNAPFSVIGYAENRIFAGFDEDAASRLVSIKRSADCSFRKQLERQGFSDEVSFTEFPLTLCNRIAIDLGIATFVNRVVRNAEEGRQLPNTFVAGRFIAFEWMTFHIANEWVQEYESGAILHSAQDR